MGIGFDDDIEEHLARKRAGRSARFSRASAESAVINRAGAEAWLLPNNPAQNFKFSTTVKLGLTGSK